jgi:tetrahydromethanopterin S-methyltransferase subunit H
LFIYIGLNRAAICSVNDDGYLYGPIRNQRPTFPPNNFNEAVINSNASSVDFTKIPKKREKLLPPLGRFQPYGISKLFK